MKIIVSSCQDCPCYEYDPEGLDGCFLASIWGEEIEDEEVREAWEKKEIPGSCPLKNEGFIEILPEEDPDDE